MSPTPALSTDRRVCVCVCYFCLRSSHWRLSNFYFRSISSTSVCVCAHLCVCVWADVQFADYCRDKRAPECVSLSQLFSCSTPASRLLLLLLFHFSIFIIILFLLLPPSFSFPFFSLHFPCLHFCPSLFSLFLFLFSSFLLFFFSFPFFLDFILFSVDVQQWTWASPVCVSTHLPPLSHPFYFSVSMFCLCALLHKTVIYNQSDSPRSTFLLVSPLLLLLLLPVVSWFTLPFLLTCDDFFPMSLCSGGFAVTRIMLQLVHQHLLWLLSFFLCTCPDEEAPQLPGVSSIAWVEL